MNLEEVDEEAVFAHPERHAHFECRERPANRGNARCYLRHLRTLHGAPP